MHIIYLHTNLVAENLANLLQYDFGEKNSVALLLAEQSCIGWKYLVGFSLVKCCSIANFTKLPSHHQPNLCSKNI